MTEKQRISPRIASIAPSVTLAITARAKAMVAEGTEVMSFAAGEPDFDTPDHIKAKVATALDAGQTKYAPNPGWPALRDAISKKLETENGLSYKPTEIVVSNGAKHSLFNVIQALCTEGEEVLVPGPFWLSYAEMIGVSGAKTVVVMGDEAKGFKVSVEQLAAATNENTKAIILNSPCNPTGIVYDKDELKAIADFCVEKGIFIISDEIYEKILYDGAEHVSIGSLSDEIFNQTITVNGFSKAFSMTGWRLGYCAGPLDIIKAVSALQSHSTSSPNTFAQIAAVEALTDPKTNECVSEMVAAFAERRERICELINGIDGMSCVIPRGAFYVFANIGSYGKGSVEFAQELLEKEHVAVIPGKPFGTDQHVRLSYACSMENIEKGLEAIARFVASIAS